MSSQHWGVNKQTPKITQFFFCLFSFLSISSLCPQMLTQGHQQYQQRQPWKSGRAVLWRLRSPLKWRKSPQQPLAAALALPLRLRKKKQKDCCTVHYAKSLSTLPHSWRRTTVVRWSSSFLLPFFFLSQECCNYLPLNRLDLLQQGTKRWQKTGNYMEFINY